MCMIITNTTGKRLDDYTIDDVLRSNPDGVGFFDLTTGELRKTLDYDESRIWLASETPYIAHARYATHGKKCLENIHPFAMHDGRLLMMNGIINGYADTKENDTRQLVNQLQYVLPAAIPHFLDCFSARFAIIDPATRSVETIGEWHERDGVLFSNIPPSADNNCWRWDDDEEDYVTDTSVNLVAVYGTLKYGYVHHDKYLGDARFVGYGITNEPYRLCVEGTPRLIEGADYRNGEYVDVEVYDVNDAELERIDMLEQGYTRERIDIELERGYVVSAWVYLADEQWDSGEYLGSFDDERFLAISKR